MTDPLGLRLVALAAAASRDDGTTAPTLPTELRAEMFPRPSVAWSGSKCHNDTLAAWLRGQVRLRDKVPGRPEGRKGSHPLPGRWVVERALAGLVRSRRLARDFERLLATSAAWPS